jgi:hypothetical protein
MSGLDGQGWPSDTPTYDSVDREVKLLLQLHECRNCLREAIDAVESGLDYYKLVALTSRWRNAAKVEE